MTEPHDLTRWLDALRAGDSAALDEIVRVLYDELRSLARSRLRAERAEHTLSATALVNEAYLKLAAHDRIGAASRTQFMAVAANTMRRILVDYARTRKRHKRGGGETPIPLEEVEPFLSEDEADEILALDEADRILAPLPVTSSERIPVRQNLSAVYARQGRWDLAEPMQREMVELRRQFNGEDSDLTAQALETGR